jgi:transposase-like protein
MTDTLSPPRLKGHRFPREIIAQAVRLYLRFNLSLRGVEELLAEMGCTEFEIMAITGHRTSQEITRYTRAASQKTRAESALKRMTQGNGSG